MLALEIKDLGALLNALAKDATVYAPVRRGNRTNFEKWAPYGIKTTATKDGSPYIDLEHFTVKSLKELVFPQVEHLLKFRTGGKKLDMKAMEPSTEKTVAFAVRSCDVRGFEILDKVFLKEPVDTFYEARRKNAVLIGLSCNMPEETCFCGTFGIDAAEPQADVRTVLAGYTLYWEPLTDKGRELTEKVKAALGDKLAEKDAAPAHAAQQKTREILKKLPLADFRLSGKLPEKELAVFNSKVWEQLAPSCMSCCTCTYVCPTCQCYDVRDEKKGIAPAAEEGGKSGYLVDRYRCWDSCMDMDFTQMAHGNPRKSKLERFRQRYMHKLVYFPEDYDGTVSCTGCGRCLKMCPVSLNIVKVAKALEAADDV